MTDIAHTPTAPHLLASGQRMPASYLRPTFPLPGPSDATPRIVGLLACQCDPLLTQLETAVVGCKKAATVNGSAKKAKNAPPEPEAWEVELIDTGASSLFPVPRRPTLAITVLFPEGGGQPSDRGTLTILASTSPEPIAVRSVFRRGLSAIHRVDAPVPIGARVRVNLDVELRHDQMTQHSAQHLISAVLEKAPFEIPTLSWALCPASSPCYIELPRAPTAQERVAVEHQCNDLIRQNLEVHVDIDRLAADEGLEKRADYIGGVKRTVTIDGVDSNPCCGTHVPSLATLQAVHILPSTTSVRGTNIRLYFLAGPRVVDNLASSLERVRLIGAELSAGQEEVVEKVRHASTQAREARTREKRLREELAASLAERLGGRLGAAQGETKTAVLVRDEDATNDIEFVNIITARVKDFPPTSSSWVAIIACCSATAPQSGGAIVVFGSEGTAAAIETVGKKIRDRCGAKVKGGGKGRFQGKLAAGQTWTKADQELFDEALAGIAK